MSVPVRNIPKRAGATISKPKIALASSLKATDSNLVTKAPKLAQVQLKIIPDKNVQVAFKKPAEATPVILNSIQTQAKQVIRQDFDALTMTDQVLLWQRLQKQADKFGYIACLLPEARAKMLTKRLGDFSEDETAGTGLRGQLWCPYCAAWRTFKNHNGYGRCIACGISDVDFYVRGDNHLWGGSDTKSKQQTSALQQRKNKVEKSEENEGEDE